MTIGQYLRPSKDHLPVARLYTPDDFHFMKVEALRMGFRHVESGPLVRSSYHAHSEQADAGTAQPPSDLSFGTSSEQALIPCSELLERLGELRHVALTHQTTSEIRHGLHNRSRSSHRQRRPKSPA